MSTCPTCKGSGYFTAYDTTKDYLHAKDFICFCTTGDAYISCYKSYARLMSRYDPSVHRNWISEWHSKFDEMALKIRSGVNTKKRPKPPEY